MLSASAAEPFHLPTIISRMLRASTMTTTVSRMLRASMVNNNNTNKTKGSYKQIFVFYFLKNVSH